MLFVGVAFFALVYLAFRNNEPAIADNSVLVLPVKGSLPDYAAQDPLASRFFGASDLSLTELLLQFKKRYFLRDAQVGSSKLKSVSLIGIVNRATISKLLYQIFIGYNMILATLLKQNPKYFFRNTRE